MARTSDITITLTLDEQSATLLGLVREQERATLREQVENLPTTDQVYVLLDDVLQLLAGTMPPDPEVPTLPEPGARPGYLFTQDRCPNQFHPIDAYPQGQACGLCGYTR